MVKHKQISNMLDRELEPLLWHTVCLLIENLSNLTSEWSVRNGKDPEFLKDVLAQNL